MDIAQKVQGKFKAVKTLLLFWQHFANSKVAFDLYRSGQPIRELKLKNGLTLHTSEMDDTWSLYKEIFIDECYTKGGFYTPKDGDVVIDCGANIGFFSHYIASFKKKMTIYALEPSAKTRKRLEHNIGLNYLGGVIRPIPFGLFNCPTTLKLQTAMFAGSSSQYIAAEEFEMIECKTLPQLLKDFGVSKVNLLKMDIEGAELEVFEGIDDETWDKIEAVTMEYHEENRPGCEAKLKATLQKHFSVVESWPLTKNNELGIMRARK